MRIFDPAPTAKSPAGDAHPGPGTVSASCHTVAEDWKTILAQAIRNPGELCRLLELPETWAEQMVQAARGFPLLVPRSVLPRIQKGNPHDPVLRQFLPTEAELQPASGFSKDPLEEQTASPSPGILAKYSGRILILTHPACPVHCRYCFRRHFPYAEVLRDKNRPEPSVDEPGGALRLVPRVVDYLRSHPDVREVIFSGGDPLLLDDQAIEQWMKSLGAISTVRRVRYHTRMPVVIPQRVTKDFVNILKTSHLACVIVLHVNHPREIDSGVTEAIGRLRESRAILLVQSVLLAGINDSAEILAELYESIGSLGVLPYYLHQLDKVSGAHHFEVPEERGREIMEQLRRILPGYLVPRYVREVPRAPSKVPLI